MESVLIDLNFKKYSVKVKHKVKEKSTTDPFYSAENIERLKESAKQLEEGKAVTKTFKELRELVNG